MFRSKIALLAAVLGIWTLAAIGPVALHAQAPVIGQGGAAPSPGLIVRGTHIFTAGPPPIFSNCGTGPITNGTDVAGSVIPGSAATTCTITFATPFQNVPFCSVDATGSSPTFTVSATAITVTVTPGGVPLMWECIGNAF